MIRDRGTKAHEIGKVYSDNMSTSTEAPIKLVVLYHVIWREAALAKKRFLHD